MDNYVLCSLQDHLRTRTCDVDHHVLVGAKNTDSWHTRKLDLQHTFPLDVPRVISLKHSFIANGDNLIGVSLTPGETIHFSSLEFTTDRHGCLSLSPYEGDSSTIFVGMVHGGSPSLHTILEDSSNEGGTASGARDSPRHHYAGPHHHYMVTSTTLALQTIPTVMVQTVALQPRMEHLPIQQQAYQEEQEARVCAP
jgi:hypothetical protein